MTRVTIIGGSRGIGLAIGRALDAPQILCLSRSPAPMPNWTWRHFDAATSALSETWSDAAEHDVLIYSAGLGQAGLILQQSDDELDALWRVNVRGFQRAWRWYVRARLGANRPATGLVVASVAASVGLKGLAAYGATKGALVSYVRAAARELSGRQVRLNALCPGFVDTEMTAGLPAPLRASLIRRTPLRRLGTVDDIARVAAFLVSDDSGWINGQAIVADGGFSC